MRGLNVTHRTLSDRLVARDIAEQIRTAANTNAVIVATNPAHMHAAIRKELHRMALATADTPTGVLRFSADALSCSFASHVTVATANDFLIAPPMCRTMYVTCAVN